MSSKVAKKTASSKTSIFARPAAKKEPAKRAASKKKRDETSDESSESSDESSEEEPPRKSKKKTEKKAASKKAEKKKKHVSSSESESESESEEEEAVESAPKAPANVSDGLARLGEGLAAVAEQLAASNATNAKTLELLLNGLTKLNIGMSSEDKDDVDFLEPISDAIARGEAVVIGDKDAGVIHHFDSVEHMKANIGRLAVQANFKKTLVTEEIEVGEVTIGTA